MLKNPFLGQNAFYAGFNPFIKIFIISEILFWSSWNAISPIFAIFVTSQVSGGSVQTVATAFSLYFLIRAIGEWFSDSLLAKSSLQQKLTMVILGIGLVSLAYFGFIFTETVSILYLLWAILGVGFALATPIKNALFSIHLDKNKETTEWGIYDGSSLIFIALSAMVGGLIANNFGFGILFFAFGVINLLSIVPYLFYLQEKGLSLSS